MIWTRHLFWIAGIYGLVVLVPQYFLEFRIGRDHPPAITHPEYFYGFVGVGAAWQVAFLIIATDPRRFRPLMIPSALEKFTFAGAVAVLFALGRAPVLLSGFGAVDFVLGVLFLIAFCSLPRLKVPTMAANIRFAEPHDAVAVHGIYAPFCESTAISFEAVAPNVAQIAERMAKISAQYPWLVCERDGQVVGYVYACQHRERAAYRWAVDVTVYIAPEHHGRGVGRALYTSLLALLRRQGYFKAYAGITLPNPGSVGLHEAIGFTRAVVYRSVGYKLGEWRDVGWWELCLQPEIAVPPEPTPILEIRDDPAVAAAIAAGEHLIRA